MIIDSIKEMTTTLQKGHPKTELVIQHGAGHEDFIIDVLLGYKEKGEGTKAIESWLGQRL